MSKYTVQWQKLRARRKLVKYWNKLTHTCYLPEDEACNYLGPIQKNAIPLISGTKITRASGHERRVAAGRDSAFVTDISNSFLLATCLVLPPYRPFLGEKIQTLRLTAPPFPFSSSLWKRFLEILGEGRILEKENSRCVDYAVEVR